MYFTEMGQNINKPKHGFSNIECGSADWGVMRRGEKH
jgi:hypothetical protein